MNDDNLQDNINHRRKVENFRLNITDEEFGHASDSELYSDRHDSDQQDGENSDTVLHSYSDPRAEQRAKQSQEEAEIRAEKAHQWRNKEKGRKNRRFFRAIWLLMVLVISALLSQFAITGVNDMLAVGRENVSITVEIPKMPRLRKLPGF